jgi:VCBS repeat-containing protein
MVTVTPANDPPSAEPDTATTAEDAAVTIAVLANDTDIDGDTLSVQAVTPGAHGAAQINGDGTVTYTPQANFNGPDSFSYTASDGYGGTAMATVSVTVTPLNDPPTAAPDSATTAEDTGTSIPVLANDTDIEGDSLTVSGVTQGAHGAVAVNGDGTVTYTPQANFNGSDSFTYTASDGHGGAATGTVTVIVTPTNDPPSAEPDTATTAEDAAVTIAVLANDADIDGDRLAVQSATPGAHGAVQINGDGSVTYTAQPNFNGSDSFSYTASDGYGGTATALVSVTVTPVNDAPTAAPDSATTAEDTATTISVLANDTDIDGDTLAVQAVTSGAHGSVQINANGTVTYTPQPNFNGSDTFTYTASDGHGGTASATVSLTVTPVDDAPVAHDDVATVTAGQSVTIAVLANDTDVDIATNGDTLTPAIVLQSPNGTAVVNANGTVTFTPNVGFAGVAVFSYRVRDAAGADSNLAIVAVTVRDNNPPVCQAATASPGEIWPPNNKRQYNVTVKGVTDPDGDALTILIARILQDEPVDTTGDGNFTPDGGGLGTSAAWVRAERMGSGNGRIYEIWFTATDSKGDSCTGRVYTTVPKSQGQPWQVIDSGVRYDSTVSVPGTRDQDGDHDQHLPKRKS